MSRSVVSSVAARVGGNPLFAEEMARRLSEDRDADAGQLPDTVHAVLAARLDSLDPFERRLVQHAAVAGRTFWPAWLARVAFEGGGDIDRALVSLQEKDLIVPAGRGALGAHGEFAFKHVLIRDVAYSQLPKAVRARRHHEMGSFIEEQAGDRADELVALLAEHYGRAAELGADAAFPEHELVPLRAKATRSLEAAGDAAAALYSNGEAFDQYGAAVRLHEGGDECIAARIREKQGDVALALGRVDAAIEAFERCAEYARGQEDLRRLGDLNRKIGSGLWHKGETKAAVERYQRGISLLKDGDPCLELVRLYEEAASLYMHTGDNMLAIYAAEKALRLAERLGESRAASRAHGIFGRVFGRIGDNGKARENLEKSVELAREASEAETIRALLSLGYHLELSEADYDGAGHAYSEAFAAAERVGDMPSQVELQAALALLAAYRGDWDAVELNAGASLDLAQREGLIGKVSYPLGLRALLHWRDGELDEAERMYREAIDLADRVGWSEVAFHSRIGLARTLRDREDWPGALEALEQAITVCEHAGLPAQLAQAAAMRVTLLVLTGRRDEAAAAARELKPTGDPAAAGAALQARGAAAEGNEAADLLAQARDTWERLDRPLDAAFCDLLAALALAADDPHRARTLATAAADRYESLGILHLAARARRATEPV